MITPATYRHVAALIRDTVDTEALTRFGHLKNDDITEKNPGDLVTIADTNIETTLTHHLQAIIPESVTVGEEASEAHPHLNNILTTDTPAWIIDPIDGTANYAAANPDYSCLVALAQAGTVHASWLYAPSLKLTAGALNGHAWLNNEPAHLTPRPPSNTLDIVTTHPGYTSDFSETLTKLDTPTITQHPCTSAGLSYIDLIQGRYDAVVYTWEKPWDHATGLHIHTTLGGTNTTMDGTPFSITGGNHLPFIAGTDHAVATLTRLLT